MNDNCYTGTNVPPILEVEPCGGIYTSTECIVQKSAIPYLKLPANSSVKNIINNLVLALPKYKVYTALLTQTGTNVPVATVLENTIGDIWFTYNSPGGYDINSDALFTENKTGLLIAPQTQNAPDTYVFQFNRVDNNKLQLLVLNADESGAVDGVLYNQMIEIRVYN